MGDSSNKGTEMNLNRQTLDREALRTLVDITGDRHFDLDKVRFDADRNEWHLFFGESQDGPFDRSFRINGVRDCRVKDRDRIGIYQMNYIKFDSKALVLKLKAEPGLDIILRVAADFAICVE